jgi:hypothetical protein
MGGEMGGCGCTNSRSGEAKLKYATKSQADVACTKLRKRYPDGDALNSYQCPEGKWWHVGNSSWDDWHDFDDENRHYGTSSKASTATIREIVGSRAAQMRATEIADAGKKTESPYQPPIAQEANNGFGFGGCLVLVVIIVALVWMFSC